MYWSEGLLQEDKSLCFLTVWSAADRIRMFILCGQCGMVRFHPVLNYKILTLSEEEIRPPEKNDK